MHPIRSGGPNTLFEITTRTDDGRRRLTPTPEVTAIILGIIGRAQALNPVRIHAFVFLASHYHMLASADNAEQMARFMCHLNGNISREINRLYDERGHTWHRRFSAIPVTGQPEAQVERLRYILSHGVKERLVSRCRDWPGASSLSWLLDGSTIRGVWHNRTAEYRATRLKNQRQSPEQFETTYEIKMSPLPCWEGLEETVWRELVGEMVQEIEEREAERGEVLGRAGTVLGLAAILAEDRHTRHPLKRGRRRNAPKIHAKGKQERLRQQRRLREVRLAYATASACYRAGDHEVEFPQGTFRPHGSFVHFSEEAHCAVRS